MPIDTSLPPWLQRNFAERPGFDPSPWLNEAFTQNVERQKLPLQLQQFALQNKALELSTEHQGIQNDLLNQELELQKDELPTFRAALETAAKTPGGSLAMAAPAFRSEKYSAAWLARQKSDADTALGKSVMEDQVNLSKLAKEVQDAGIDPTPALVNGRWDRSALSDLQLKAVEDKNMREANLRRLADPTLRFAQDTANLRADLRASEAKTAGIGVLSPTPAAMTAEVEHQQQLKDQLAVMESKLPSAAVTPALQVIGGKQFLVNPKTGAVHEISKTVSKEEFIANHISSWMKDNLWTADEAAKALNDFYDKNLGPSVAPSASQPSKSLRVGSVVEQNGKRYRYQGGPEKDASRYIEIK